MCCFRLHFSDFNVLFLQKNKKTCCGLLLEKITFCAKREKKITCYTEKSQPPPDIKWSVPYIAQRPCFDSVTSLIMLVLWRILTTWI